jgi:hypothetical protein
LEVVAQKCPRAIELLADYGLSCANCPLRPYETIEIGAKIHGFSDKEILKMIKDINDQIA